MNEKITITIPTGWDDITIDDYMKVRSTAHLKNAGDIAISVLCKLDMNTMSALPMHTRGSIIEKLSWMAGSPDATRYKTVLDLNNRTYVIRKLEDLKVGEWIDLSNYCESNLSDMHKAIALLYAREDGTESDPEDFKSAKVSECFQSLVFFSLTASNYTRILAFFLAKNAKAESTSDLLERTTKPRQSGWLPNLLGRLKRGRGTSSSTA